jgi:predicted nucleic acid-binding protein
MEGTKEVLDSYCSSDDEVFFGPITLKEVKKVLTMRRRTKVLNRTSE